MAQCILAYKLRSREKDVMNFGVADDVTFSQNWPANRKTSDWFFTSLSGERTYLKLGWNTIGSRRTSNIQINVDSLKATEFLISCCCRNITCLPTILDVSGTCTYNGVTMNGRQLDLEDDTYIGIGSCKDGTVVLIQFKREPEFKLPKPVGF